MKLTYRKAEVEDAELLIGIYNASFYRDYLKYGECPGYGKTKEMMTRSITESLKLIIPQLPRNLGRKFVNFV